MIQITFTTLLILLASHSGCFARPVFNATVREKVTLPCQTNLPYPVDWKYKLYHTGKEDYIFVGGNRGMYWQHHNRTKLTVTNVTGTNVTTYNLTLYSLTVNDTGIYTCIEDEGLGTKHPFWLQVYARRAEPVVSSAVGGTVMLSCGVPQPADWKYTRSDGAEEIYIFIAGKKGECWQHYDRTQLTTNATNNYSLVLHNVIVRDTGVYTCVEKMGNKTKQSVWLQVYDRRTRRVINATAGEKVTLPCRTENNYPVDWKYKKHDTDMDETIFLAGKPYTDWRNYDRMELISEAGDYNLIIRSVTMSDTGEYTCITDDGLGIIHPFWLQITQVIIATAGDKVTFPCHTEFNGPVDWKYKNRDALTEEMSIVNASNDRIELISEVGDYNLTIHDVTMSDSGLYTCIELGTGIRYPFRLRVSYPRRVINATVGGNVTFPCHTELDSSVDWKYKNDKLTEEMNIFKAGKPGGYWQHHDRTELASDAGDYNLILRSVTVGDTGAYTCIEDEGRGDVQPFVLQVYSPDPPVAPPSDSNAGLAIGVSIGLLVLLIVVITVVIIFRMIRRQLKCKSRERMELLPHKTDYKMILEKKYKEISKSLVVDESLLEELSAAEYCEQKGLETTINRQETREEKVSTLLKILSGVPQEQIEPVFNVFVWALRKSGQEAVADLFPKTKDTLIPMSEVNRQLLISLTKRLVQRLNPTDKLLQCLVRQRVFSKRDNDKVASNESYEEKSRQVIDILLEKPESAFDKFITALRESDQEEVAYILTGEFKPFLSPVRHKVLQHTRGYLTDNIDLSDTLFIDQLVSAGIINSYDNKLMSDKDSNQDKCSVLVDALSRKSDKTYDGLIEFLKKSEKLNKVAEHLDKEEEVVCRLSAP